MAGIVDQHIVWQWRLTQRGARLAVNGECTSVPRYFRFRPVDFVLDGVVEAGVAFLFVVLKKVTEDFRQCLEQIGFSAAVFADEYVDKTVAIKTQGKVSQVFVLANGE